MTEFKLQDFANEVYYSMKERNYRELTDDQQATIADQKAAGTWDNSAFTNALIRANDTWASDVVEGHVEASGVEGRLKRLVDQCTEASPMLGMAAKALVTESFKHDIQEGGVHEPTIHTHAQFHLQDATENALRSGLNGNTEKLEEFATRGGNRGGFQMAAMGTLGMMKAHLAANPPAEKTGLSANLSHAVKPS